jgi:cold shock CspA family protein
LKKEGFVKWYSFENGYGFITTEIDGKETDVFLHFSELKNTFSRLEEGDLLEFELAYISEGRPKATNIYLKKD